MSRLRGFGRQRLIGAAVVLLFPLIVILGWQRPFSIGGPEMTEIEAVFDSAHGISKVGNDVRLQGARIGKIVEVDRTGDDDALITMEIERDSANELRRDARAELRPRFAFEGTAFIDLFAGSRSAGALGDRQIPLEHTRSYVPLDQAFKALRPGVRRDVREVLKDVNSTLDASGITATQRIFERAPGLFEPLALGMRAAAGPTRSELTGTVRGFSGTLEALAAEERALRTISDRGARTMRAFGTDGGRPLGTTLRTSPAVLASVEPGGRALTRILDRLDPFVRDLGPSVRDVPRTLSVARRLLTRAPAAFDRVTPVIGDLRGAVDSGGAASRPATQLLDTLRPTVDTLRTSLLPTLQEKTPDLKLPTYQAVINLLQGGAGAFAPYQTPDQAKGLAQTGAGHFVRFDGRFYAFGAPSPVPPCTLLEKLLPQQVDAFAKAGICRR